jgi:hypothetical protein
MTKRKKPVQTQAKKSRYPVGDPGPQPKQDPRPKVPQPNPPDGTPTDGGVS